MINIGSAWRFLSNTRKSKEYEACAPEHMLSTAIGTSFVLKDYVTAQKNQVQKDAERAC